MVLKFSVTGDKVMKTPFLKFDATDMQKANGELILSGETEQTFEFLKRLGLPVVAVAIRRSIVVRKQLIVWWDGFLVCEPISA
jgi:hypothetical protein